MSYQTLVYLDGKIGNGPDVKAAVVVLEILTLYTYLLTVIWGGFGPLLEKKTA